MGAGPRFITEQQRRSRGRRQAQEVGRPYRQPRFGDFQSRGPVTALGVEKREVETVVQGQGGDPVVRGDGHGQEQLRLGLVAALHGHHDATEEALGGLPRGHGLEIDRRGGTQSAGWGGRRPARGRRLSGTSVARPPQPVSP